MPRSSSQSTFPIEVKLARRNLHDLPTILVPDSVQEMIASKDKEGASDAYRKVLRVHLGQVARPSIARCGR